MSIKVEDYFAPETFQRMKAFADGLEAMQNDSGRKLKAGRWHICNPERFDDERTYTLCSNLVDGYNWHVTHAEPSDPVYVVNVCKRCLRHFREDTPEQKHEPEAWKGLRRGLGRAP